MAAQWISDEEHDDFVNSIIENAPDDWDCDEAAEEIALRYVRHLEAEVKRLGGQLFPHVDD